MQERYVIMEKARILTWSESKCQFQRIITANVVFAFKAGQDDPIIKVNK